MDKIIVENLLCDARDIILRLKDRQPVSKNEIQDLLDRVFALSESADPIERQMFVLGIEIFEHYRDPAGPPLEEVEQLVNLLNELPNAISSFAPALAPGLA